MSLVASVVVSALPLIGGVHLDADAQARAVLGWQHLRGSRFVVEVADVRDGRLAGPPHRLWRAGGTPTWAISTSRARAPRWPA